MSTVRIVLISAVVSLVMQGFCFIVLIRGWGEQQGLRPRDLQQDLWVGMSRGEVERRLGAKVLDTIPIKDGFSIQYADTGLGSFFERQYNIYVRYDSKERVTGAAIEEVDGMDDTPLSFSLPAAP